MNDEVQKVKDLEMELLQLETRKSVKKLNQLLSDDFFEFTQSGTATSKKDIIEYLPNSPDEEFKIRELEAKVLSEGVILLHYIADRRVIESGEEKCTLCSSVWQKKDDRWQMVFFQGTPAQK